MIVGAQESRTLKCKKRSVRENLGKVKRVKGKR